MAAEAAPTMYTRGEPGAPDTRGESMVRRPGGPHDLHALWAPGASQGGGGWQHRRGGWRSGRQLLAGARVWRWRWSVLQQRRLAIVSALYCTVRLKKKDFACRRWLLRSTDKGFPMASRPSLAGTEEKEATLPSRL